MERWSFETHRDDTWIYGKTYVDGEFTTNWMQLIAQPKFISVKDEVRKFRQYASAWTGKKPKQIQDTLDFYTDVLEL